MVFLENLLILMGIGLDVFAAFEIQGALLAQVKKKPLVVACAVVAALELVAYFIGYVSLSLLANYGYISNPKLHGERAAVIVLAILGLRLLIKAIKREFIHEKRKDRLNVWEYIRSIIVSCIYTLAAGCVSGLIGTSIAAVIVLILVISVLMVIGGLYTGFHLGFENKTVAYVIGVIFLWGVSIEILLTEIINIF